MGIGCNLQSAIPPPPTTKRRRCKTGHAGVLVYSWTKKSTNSWYIAGQKIYKLVGRWAAGGGVGRGPAFNKNSFTILQETFGLRSNLPVQLAARWCSMLSFL